MTVDLTQSSAVDERTQLRNVAEWLETIRELRKRRAAEQGYPSNKRFTQEELSQTVFPSYKNILLGITRRLPSRASLLRIAEYLECSLTERNELMLTAQYLPEALQFTGAAAENAVRAAVEFTHTAPFPAYVIAPECRIAAANAPFYTMNGLSDVERIAAAERNPLHFLFNPLLPIRHLITPTPLIWQQNTLKALVLFRHITELFRYEGWYAKMLEQAVSLPDFPQLWKQAAESDPSHFNTGFYLQGHVPDTAHPYWVQLAVIRLTASLFPLIVTVMPVEYPQPVQLR
ncbi:MAG: hypothetical protein SF162_02950 [bacterium]|nr:hypothetical protein [bacterium]